MKIIRGIQNIRESIPYPVLTIGNFDGVHLGHQAIFKNVTNRSKETGGTGIVFTFEPHPRKIIESEKYLPPLTTFNQKTELIKKTGIDLLICADFTPDLAAQSAREFTKNTLVEKINIKEVFAGHDFNFGKGREGTIDYFKEMGKEFGFKVEVLDPVKINGEIVSSSFIRSLISEGQVKKAARHLDRPYSLEGKVVGGCKIGSAIGFPTANIDVHHNLIPHRGVYAVQVVVQKKKFNGVANIGYNPTFKRNQFTVEVYIFDFTENLYNQTVRLLFIKKIRDEVTFSTEEELKAQIQKDTIEAKEILIRDLH